MVFAFNVVEETDEGESRSNKEVVHSKKSDMWIKIMHDEISSLNKNVTWISVNKSDHKW